MTFLNKFLLRIIRKIAKDEHAELSWSQEGEDIILRRFLSSEEWKNNGFYVDIGAHHPKLYSNTYYFYQCGWRGINIDANEEAIRLFNTYRPGDINICSGIGLTASTMKYYMFETPALNTFSEVRYDQIKTKFPLKTVVEAPIRPLAEILQKYLPDKNQRIDFMNIDVEGMDYDVLLSNDWTIYRPNYLLIEIWNNTKEEAYSSKEVIFLKDKGYSLIAMACNTFIFKLE